MNEEILDSPEPHQDPKKEATNIKRNVMGLGLLVILSSVIAFYYLSQNSNRNLDGAEPVRTFRETIIPDSLSEQYSEGLALFLESCAACHHNDMITDLTGPALKGATERRSQEWLINYIRNSMQMVADKDSTAVALFEQWDGALMTSFPNLSDEDILNILIYIENK